MDGNSDIPDPGAAEIMGIAFSPDGKLFVRTAFRPSTPNLIVHRTDTWEQVWGVGTPGFSPYAVALSPDGKYAAVGGIRGSLGNSFPIIDHPQVLIVDLASHAITQTIAAFPDNNQIQTLAWSPDGS